MVSAGRTARPTLPVDERLGQTGSYDSTAVSTSATLVVAADTDRQSVLVQNLSTDTPAYVGFDNAVTAASGVRVPAGGGVYSDDSFTGDIYVIAESGTVDIRHQEVTR